MMDSPATDSTATDSTAMDSPATGSTATFTTALDSPALDLPMMDSPALYLPPPFADDTIQTLLSSIHLPRAKTISYLDEDAAYHSIYELNFDQQFNDWLKPAKTLDADGSISLILRVSGKHLPRVKTINEVAVMKWVRENTTIPVPEVVYFDPSERNLLGHEYTLLEKVPGVNLSSVWGGLDIGRKLSVLSQIADYLAQMHAYSFEWIGGLQLPETGDSIVTGPLVDETFWQAPTVAIYWPAGESVSTLNISGPYKSYTALCAAEVERVIYAIGRHDSLAWIRDLVPRLQAFVNMLSHDREKIRDMKLNDAKIVLAHRGLHFDNIMFQPLTNKITGIID